MFHDDLISLILFHPIFSFVPKISSIFDCARLYLLICPLCSCVFLVFIIFSIRHCKLDFETPTDAVGSIVVVFNNQFM